MTVDAIHGAGPDFVSAHWVDSGERRGTNFRDPVHVYRALYSNQEFVVPQSLVDFIQKQTKEEIMAKWSDDGDLVMDGGERFRQIGWHGQTGRLYSMDEDWKPTEPGGVSPVYMQLGD